MTTFEVQSRTKPNTHYSVTAVDVKGKLKDFRCHCLGFINRGRCFHVATAQAKQMLEQYSEVN